MGTTANSMLAARLKARQRRIALDVDREARDRRVEQIAADVLGLIDERAVAEQAVSRANIAIGDALRRLIEDDLNAESVAKLVDLEVTEVRTLTRPTTAKSAGATAEVVHHDRVHGCDNGGARQRSVTRPIAPLLVAPPRCAAPPSDAC